MAGRSSGGRSSSRSSSFSLPSRAARSSSSSKRKSKPAPAPTSRPAPAPAPAPVHQTGGGLGSVVAEGMAFGGGNAIAHRVVDAMFGPRTVRSEAVASTPAAAPDACSNQFSTFKDCLNSSVSEISKCQFYMNMLAECRKSSSPGALVV